MSYKDKLTEEELEELRIDMLEENQDEFSREVADLIKEFDEYLGKHLPDHHQTGREVFDYLTSDEYEKDKQLTKEEAYEKAMKGLQ